MGTGRRALAMISRQATDVLRRRDLLGGLDRSDLQQHRFVGKSKPPVNSHGQCSHVLSSRNVRNT
jgi:hypothetical protein